MPHAPFTHQRARTDARLIYVWRELDGQLVGAVYATDDGRYRPASIGAGQTISYPHDYSTLSRAAVALAWLYDDTHRADQCQCPSCRAVRAGVYAEVASA